MSDDPRLERQARALIADPHISVLVSAVSLWEIVVKVRIGKLVAEIDAIVTAMGQQGFTILPIDPAHLTTLAGLPRLSDHRDPFDHLLIAQAMAEGATLLSEDRNMRRYPLTLLTCSDGAG
ncbi:twitching motility protein PilT [Methylobacterium sp. Leaf123]|uniref:type II toxin-antitoxin system VapC family toxin n=1 Tax=Methylobacterium sp. Leaf123 TaxID=1736264 RepID=UPI0006F9132A|nr:type II toxin-antitoxin system VapC family toxin [Methylobacterium sp. Leaf123]KQQ26145.1 twitching motility protein PilT [Methylobacterium sp. Leaf123]